MKNNIAVCILTYKRPRYILDTLDTILQQKLPHTINTNCSFSMIFKIMIWSPESSFGTLQGIPKASLGTPRGPKGASGDAAGPPKDPFGLTSGSLRTPRDPVGPSGTP